MCHAELAPGRAATVSAAEQVTIPLPSGEEMPALLALPAETRARAVLVIPDVYGPSPFYEDLASRLARAGFEALLPDYFFRQGPLPERSREAAIARRRELDEAATVEDLGAALRWLRAREGYVGEVGVLGFCMGGTFALDLAAYESDLVTVAYYGFPRPQATLAKPPPAPLELVENMTGPILAFWGDADETVGIENVEEFLDDVAAAGIDFTGHVYPGLGHGFLALANLDESSDDRAAESWRLALAHLETHLGPQLESPVLHHINLKTTRPKEMMEWYSVVARMRPGHVSDVGIWLTNDGANHRLALLSVPALSDDPEKLGHAGFHHAAFEFSSCDALLGHCQSLLGRGIRPHVVLDHGMTLSFYFVDPDGNSVELQCDNFGDWRQSSQFVRSSPEFAADPIGRHVDPDQLIAAWRDGADGHELHRRAYGGDFEPDRPIDLRLPA